MRPLCANGCWRSALLAFLCCATGAAEKIRVGLPLQPISAGIVLAKQRGYFSDERLDVEFVEFATGKEALVKLFAGELDYALAAETPLVFASLNEEKFVILATIGRTSTALAFVGRRDRGVNDVSQIRGKRVGLTRGTNAEFFLETFRVWKGVPATEVEIIDLSAESLESSISEGRIDAACVWEPYLSRIKAKLGTAGYYFNGEGMYLWCWNLVERLQAEQKTTERSEKILRALIRSGGDLQRDPALGAVAMSSILRLPAKSLGELLSDHNFNPQLTQELVLQMEAQCRWLIRAQNRVMPNFLRYIDSRPLKHITPDAVTVIE